VRARAGGDRGAVFPSGDKLRRNVTEGKPGVPLMKLTVLDVSTCRPIKGAAVDIWHCDAVGTYAAQTSKTFLRGIQRTDANGVATFKTIYPGWYQGRTVHIHVRVWLGGNVVHMGQLYFPDSLTDKVYARTPYKSRPARTTRNPDDAIYRNGGSLSTLRLRKVGGYTGSITMGIQR
jgi:protocatechuate 3,4-dioxygenase beta subunit